MTSLEPAPHPLPLELIRNILESCVQCNINEEPSIAVDLQLVSRTTREWLAPLIYAIFVIRPPRADYKGSETTGAASSSLRVFHSLLHTTPGKLLSPRRHIQTLAIEPDPRMLPRILGLKIDNASDPIPVWPLGMVLVPSLSVWTSISQFARGALRPRVVSCIEELLTPLGRPLLVFPIQDQSEWNGLRGLSELRVCLDRDATVPDMIQSRRRRDIARKYLKLQELRHARLERRSTGSTGPERPAQPACYEVLGRPDSIVLRANLLEEKDVALMKETVSHLLIRDISGDEMKVIVEVLQTDEPPPYLIGPALLRDLRAALDPELADRVTLRAGPRCSSIGCTVAEEVQLQRMRLMLDRD